MKQGEVEAVHRERRTRPRSTGALLRVTAIVAALAALASPAPVHAHTDLVGSTPRPGDTVSMRTDQLVLVFGEALAGPGQVTARDADDHDVVTGRSSVTGDTLEVPLDLRRAGRHVVTYRVVAADGHVVVGEFDFVVFSPPPRAQSEVREDGGAADSVASRDDGRSGTNLPPTAAEVGLPEAATESSNLTPAWWLVAIGASACLAWLLLRLLPGFISRLRRPPP